MPHYMIQAAYTSDAIAALARTPEDRSQALRSLCEKLGGKMHAFYGCFGEWDVVAMLELPGSVAALTASMTIGSAGHIRAFKTTPLVTTGELMDAMKRAGSIGYTAPIAVSGPA
jgi:uncharacterized protein with GYD domain